jgi:predicted nucleic acid-binding protein
MMEVLDASIGLKWVLNEAEAGKARTLRDEFRTSLRDFIAPDVFAVECAHALTKGARRGIIQDALTLYGEIMMDSPRLFSSISLMDRAIQIATKARIGVYDCLYVALAEREGCEFITADDRLVRALGPTFPFIISLASLP